jgi:hypothetical protein
MAYTSILTSYSFSPKLSESRMLASKKECLQGMPASVLTLPTPPGILIEFCGRPFDKLPFTLDFVETIDAADVPPALADMPYACHVAAARRTIL